MKSSPIYNIINNPGRVSDCSFGVKNRFDQTVRVGTSSSNSHCLGSISVEMHDGDNDGERVFNMFLDGRLVKTGILNGKDFEITKDAMTE